MSHLKINPMISSGVIVIEFQTRLEGGRPVVKPCTAVTWKMLFWRFSCKTEQLHVAYPNGTGRSYEACACESSSKAHGLCLRKSSHYLSIFTKRTFSSPRRFAACSHWGNFFPSSSEKIRIRDDQIVYRQKSRKAKKFLSFCPLQSAISCYFHV